MEYEAARRRHMGPVMDHQATYGGQGGLPTPIPLGRGGFPSTDANGKAVYRNRQEEMRDPDFHRPRWVLCHRVSSSFCVGKDLEIASRVSIWPSSNLGCVPDGAQRAGLSI